MRPSVNCAGLNQRYRIRRFNIACEASYMAAWGNFGKLGNVAQDVRVGLLIGYRF
jgi:hypothetical protein